MRQRRGAPGQSRVAERAAGVAGGRSRGGEARLPCEEFVEERSRRLWTSRPRVEVVEEAAALRLAEHGERADGPGGALEGRLQQPQVAGAEPPDPLPVEQVAVVLNLN